MSTSITAILEHSHHPRRRPLPISSQPPSPCPPAPGNHPPAFCPYGFAFSGLSLWVESCSVWTGRQSHVFFSWLPPAPETNTYHTGALNVIMPRPHTWSSSPGNTDMKNSCIKKGLHLSGSHFVSGSSCLRAHSFLPAGLLPKGNSFGILDLIRKLVVHDSDLSTFPALKEKSRGPSGLKEVMVIMSFLQELWVPAVWPRVDSSPAKETPKKLRNGLTSWFDAVHFFFNVRKLKI